MKYCTNKHINCKFGKTVDRNKMKIIHPSNVSNISKVVYNFATAFIHCRGGVENYMSGIQIMDMCLVF